MTEASRDPMPIDDEADILLAHEQGEMERASEAERIIADAVAAARAHISERKSHRINLRMTERDLKLAKLFASRDGIPYQTLLVSAIHKYLARRIEEGE